MAKTQASHTAPPVQPVDDSAWETVKPQARHSPATCPVFSTIHPAADSAWKNLKAESVPVRDTSDEVIIQDGRSDPAAHSFEEFRLADAGICLATRSEPDEAKGTCHPHGEHRTGVSEKGGAAPKDLLAVCCCQRGFGAAFSNNSLLAQNSQVWFHTIDSKTRWMFAVVQ